jgi:tyrosine-protein kinase Etk/Wzc
MARYPAELKTDARNALAASARISSGKDGLITVEVDDKEPAFAATLANAYVEELGKLLNRLAVTEAQQRRAFFEKQLTSAKDNLVKAEIALKASGVNSSALKATPAAAVEGLARLKAGITAQEIKLASMRGYLSESAPDFKQAQTELAAMRSQLARTEKPEPTTPGDADYVARYRDYKYFETLFELFTKQLELAKVDEAREGAVIQVLDAAQPPERKSKPKKAQIAMIATLATGFALLLFVFIRQALRSAAQTPESAQKLSQLRQSWRKAMGMR